MCKQILLADVKSVKKSCEYMHQRYTKKENKMVYTSRESNECHCFCGLITSG